MPTKKRQPPQGAKPLTQTVLAADGRSQINVRGRRIDWTAGAVDWVQAAEGEDQPKVPKFSAVAYTGGLLSVAAFYYPAVIDLAGLTVRGQSIPALLDHDSAQIVGHADAADVAISAQSVKVAGLISGGGEAAGQVVAAARNGFPWKISVGAQLTKVERVEQGATATANGQTFTGPVNIVRAATLEEISFLAIAADAKTSVKVAASAKQPARSDTMEFEQWVQAEFHLDPATLTDAQRAKLQARFDKEHAEPAPMVEAGATPPAADANPVASYRQQMAAETARVGSLQAEAKGEFPELMAGAIRDGWDLPRFQAELKRERELRDLRAGRARGPAIHSEGGSQLTAQTVEAALCLSAGMRADFLAKHFDDKTLSAAGDRRLRSASLHLLMDETLRAAGDYYSGNRKSEDFIRAALGADQRCRLQAGFSSVSLSGILSNVANKAMLAAYEAAEVVWPYFCAARTNVDFKPHTSYRLDSTGAFKKVGPDGELKHAGLADATYSRQLDTYGTIVGLTRQMMFNDDLGAFLQIPTLLGRMCAVKVEEEAFKLLLSNPSSFFAAGHGNLITGAGTALSIDSLTDAETKFRNQVDSNKKPILASPKILLVPTTLKVTADNLYAEKLLIAGTSSSKQPARNPHAGKYLPHTSPYLNNTAIRDSDGAAISGQSDTGWYLFADPMVRAAIVVATLNGRLVPVIEASDAEFNTLGVQWRAYHDFGVGMEDTVAAVRADGV